MSEREKTDIYPVLIDEMCLFCEEWYTYRKFHASGFEFKEAIRIKGIYFESIEDVLEFCKQIISKAKIIGEKK